MFIRYVGVDINPSSEATMRQMVENILPQERIEYCISSFDNFQLERDQSDDSIAVATMLGFQEGNEAPTVMRSWLEAILKPGDILLSELQLYQPKDVGKLQKFYHHPAMVRFSRLAFERAIDGRPIRTEHSVFR